MVRHTHTSTTKNSNVGAVALVSAQARNVSLYPGSPACLYTASTLLFLAVIEWVKLAQVCLPVLKSYCSIEEKQTTM